MSPTNNSTYQKNYMKKYWQENPEKYKEHLAAVKAWKQRRQKINRTVCKICGFEVPATDKAVEVDKPLHGLEHDQKVQWITAKQWARWNKQ